jgi:hypothetical protein
MKSNKNEVLAWFVAIIFGLCAAAIHLLVPEQGLTFLWVMATTMILGVWKRDRPWRWIILIVPFIPIADFAHKFIRPAQVSRAALWGALLTFLAAIPGAYGGSYMRLMIDNIFLKKEQ